MNLETADQWLAGDGDGMHLTRMEAKGTFWNDGNILGVVIRWVYKFIRLIYVIVLKPGLNKVECKQVPKESKQKSE